ELPELAFVLVRHDVEEAVGSLANVANPLFAIDEQVFLSRHALPFDLKSNQALLTKPPDEYAAAPLRKRIAGVPLHARRGDDWIPVIDRLLEAARLWRRTFDGDASVFYPIGLQRPSVIPAGSDEVQLIAAARAVLNDPVAALRVHRCRLDVAMTERKDLRHRALFSHEGVVIGNAAVRPDAQGLAHMVVELLRKRPHVCIRPVARRDVEQALLVEDKTRAEVVSSVVGGHRAEDHLHIGDTSTVLGEHATSDGRAVAPLAWLRVRPENQAAGFEIGGEGHVEQAPLALCVHVGQAAYGLTQCPIGTDHAHPSRALRDQEAAIRERLNGPGMLEAVCQHDGLQVDVRRHAAGPGLSLAGRLLSGSLGWTCLERFAVGGVGSGGV